MLCFGSLGMDLCIGMDPVISELCYNGTIFTKEISWSIYYNSCVRFRKKKNGIHSMFTVISKFFDITSWVIEGQGFIV